MNAYFERLKTETNWFKLFVPIFIVMTAFLVLIAPVIVYIIEVVIKNNEYGGNHPIYAVCVSPVFSAVLAAVIGYRHKVLNSTEESGRSE